MRKYTLTAGAVIMAGIALIAGLWGCGSATTTQPVVPSHSDVSHTTDNSTPFEAFFVTTSQGNVDVIGIEPIPAEKLVRLRLLLRQGAVDQVEQTLTTQISSDIDSTITLRTFLGSADNQPLWELEYILWSGDENRTTTIIRSGPDSLVVMHSEAVEEIAETYIANGTYRTYHMAFADMAHATEVYQAGLRDGRFSSEQVGNRNPADKHLIAMLRDCQQFYDENPILRISDEANLAVQLLQKDRIVRTIKANIGTEEDQQTIEKWWRKLCAGAGICTYFACTYFGPNGACLACGAVALGCALFEWATN